MQAVSVADLLAQLQQVSAQADQKQKFEAYKQLLHTVLAVPSIDTCTALVDHLASDDVPLVVSRQTMQQFAQELRKAPADVHKPVAQYALERLQPRAVSFEEQATLLRENLAQLLQDQEQWTQAAQVLAGIDLDSGVRNVDSRYKLEKNIRIAMLYLEDDDSVNAEMYIKKASSLISGSKDPVLELQYKTCYARIMDSKRRFLDAALRYYELSSLPQRAFGEAGLSVGEDDLSLALSSAITCTILAAAGPQRSRMLSSLYKDERSARLPVYPFLERVYLERILRREDVEAFASMLKPHQMALLPDGSTVLGKSVMQHNLLSASKLYNNIRIEELGTLLGVPPDKAEQVAADMISEGRLSGIIDQVAGLIHFDDAVEPLVQWDRQITATCVKVDALLDAASASGVKVATAAGGS